MKRGDISNWSNISECQNLLFFAQLVVELLFDYSIPSNRISTLNSHYLCRDAMSTIKSIDENGVPEGTLKPIMAELHRSLSADITFKSRGINPLKYFVKLQTNGTYCIIQRTDDLSFEDSHRIVLALYQKYFKNKWYSESLVDDIREFVINNKVEDQLALFRQTKAWLTELINGGYSAKYIYSTAIRYFYPHKDKIDNPNHIDEFLKQFDYKKSKYKIVLIASKEQQRFLSTVDKMELLDSLKPSGKTCSESNFLNKRSHEKFVLLEIEEYDPFSAVEHAKRILSDNVSIYRMYDHNYNFDLSSLKCGVYDDLGAFYRVNEDVSAVQRAKTPAKKNIEEKTAAVTRALYTSIKQRNISGFATLMNAINAHSLSLDSNSEQNQLLDLWSIFETVLDISNKHISDRIQQVCVYVLPVLKHKYIFSLFHQLANDLRNYSEEVYMSMAKDSKNEFDTVKRLCEFVLLDSKENERTLFLEGCMDFPLLKERIEYYHTQLATPNKIYNFVEKHSERVKWQVMRIYRNRNLIIHNGETSPYLKLLVENLHSYVDDFLDYVINMMSKGCSLPAMCQELFVKECEWKEKFQPSKAVLTVELVDEMLRL